MRGQREHSGSLFSYVSIEERIPASHPLRRIRNLADQALDRLNPTFCELYAAEGRPSVPGLPESYSGHVSAGLNASQCQHSFDVVSQLPDALPN